METSSDVVDQVRRTLSRVRTGARGRARSWTRSSAPPPPPPEASVSRRSSFVRSATRYVERPPER